MHTLFGKIKMFFTRKIVLPPPFILPLRNTNFLLSTTYCVSLWHEGYPFNMAMVLTNLHWKYTWVVAMTPSNENHETHDYSHFCAFYLINFNQKIPGNGTKTFIVKMSMINESSKHNTKGIFLLSVSFWQYHYLCFRSPHVI